MTISAIKIRNENSGYRMSIKLQRKTGGIIKRHSTTNTIPSSNAFIGREIYHSKTNKLNDISFSSEENDYFFSIHQSYSSLATSPSYHPSESPTTSNTSQNPPLLVISTLAPSIMPSRYPIDSPTYRSCHYNNDDDVTTEIITFDYEVITASKEVDVMDALREVERGLFRDVSESLLDCNNVRMLSMRLGRSSTDEGSEGLLIAIDSKPLDVIDREQSDCQKPMPIPNPGPCIRINGAITTSTTCSAAACISPKDKVLETIKQGMSQKTFTSENVLQVSFVGDENNNTIRDDHVNDNSETSHGSSKGDKLVLGGIVVISIGAFVSILLLVKLAKWKTFRRRIRRKRLEEDNERQYGGDRRDDSRSDATIVTDDCYVDNSPCCSGLSVCSTSLDTMGGGGDDIIMKSHRNDTRPITKIEANTTTTNKTTDFSFDAKPAKDTMAVEMGLAYVLDSINENNSRDDKSQSPTSIDHPNNVSIRSISLGRVSSKQSDDDDDDDDLLGLSVLSDSTATKVVTGSIASTTSSHHLDHHSFRSPTSLSYCLSPSFSYRTHDSSLSSSSPNDNHRDGAVRHFSSPDETRSSRRPHSVDIYISPSIINSLSSTTIADTPPTPRSDNYYHSPKDDDDARRKPLTPPLAAAQDDVEFSSPNFSLSTYSSRETSSPMNFDSSMGSSSNDLSSPNGTTAAFVKRKIDHVGTFWACDDSFNEKREI